jgi:hypothetical protein
MTCGGEETLTVFLKIKVTLHFRDGRSANRLLIVLDLGQTGLGAEL